ncbi:hypothetical protein F892_03121 [Acinetobacter vivianii]|uniref:DNA circulation N-terminal domain-containing protein n=1 Tax=Acinetobacter vivianii TaxID=1776742 RepID=N9NGV1_9GAMM|nr:DNA circularization N-terminal domain-containing protein [Acinetobacter vivianii]ENX20198.1 hypothetical protein F892_03121 [Acinetobacter vivianii]GGI59354.1 hypothetical protein GCM10011446_08490 [Acinetobacter vivianii]
MGWKDDLQDASFRGVKFACTLTSDSGSKTLAIKQAPYTNKAKIEDMGNNPDRIQIDAIFEGDNYKVFLEALLAAIKATGPGELIHPIYGLKNVYVDNHSVNHVADEINFCRVSLSFVEAESKDRPLFIPVSTTAKLDSKKIIDSPLKTLEKELDNLKRTNPNNFFTVVNNIRKGINTARQYVGLVKKTVNNLLSPSELITGLVDDVTRLVTFDTSISAITKWKDLFKRIQRFEKLFTGDDSPAELKHVWRAVRVASVVGVTQQAIETLKKEMADNDDLSFTPIDLNIIRQQNRSVLQQAINAEREQSITDLEFESIAQIQIYKNIADQVHLQIQELIEVRPPLIKTTVRVPCTMHFLAHFLYGDFERADEIQRLNPDLQLPCLLQTGMELNVYAR